MSVCAIRTRKTNPKASDVLVLHHVLPEPSQLSSSKKLLVRPEVACSKTVGVRLGRRSAGRFCPEVERFVPGCGRTLEGGDGEIETEGDSQYQS